MLKYDVHNHTALTLGGADGSGNFKTPSLLVHTSFIKHILMQSFKYFITDLALGFVLNGKAL